MNTFKIFALVMLLFVSSSSLAEFQVYEALLYKNKPDLKEYKLKPIPIIYEATMFSTKKLNQLPGPLNISHATTIINQSGTDKAIIDIERWPLTGNKLKVRESIAKYKKVIEDLKSKGVNASIGYYGAPPIRDFWRAVNAKNSGKYIAWQKDNDNLKSIAEVVDVFYPSIYTFYPHQEGWIKYAESQISEARRLANGKPVIAFLWPKYHESNKLLRGKYVPAKFWRIQLETVKSLADGVVIWGGWKEEWNPNAEWWLETLNFIEENNL